MAKFTEQELEDIGDKIDSEGFDYYFNDYGPDKKLANHLKEEIDRYRKARARLIDTLIELGVHIND